MLAALCYISVNLVWLGMLTYADVCARMLTYAMHIGEPSVASLPRSRTHADVCARMLTYAMHIGEPSVASLPTSSTAVRRCSERVGHIRCMLAPTLSLSAASTYII